MPTDDVLIECDELLRSSRSIVHATETHGAGRCSTRSMRASTRRWKTPTQPRLHARVSKQSKPTIAMVQGYCIFGGWMIVSAMELVFASPDARFLAGLVETSRFRGISIPARPKS